MRSKAIGAPHTAATATAATATTPNRIPSRDPRMRPSVPVLAVFGGALDVLGAEVARAARIEAADRLVGKARRFLGRAADHELLGAGQRGLADVAGAAVGEGEQAPAFAVVAFLEQRGAQRID